RGRECLEPEVLQVPRGAVVPRIGDDEAPGFVELTKDAAPLGDRGHGHIHYKGGLELWEKASPLRRRNECPLDGRGPGTRTRRLVSNSAGHSPRARRLPLNHVLHPFLSLAVFSLLFSPSVSVSAAASFVSRTAVVDGVTLHYLTGG